MKYSQPPVSLHGQLIWREFFYLCAANTPNFGQMRGNPICKQIDWDTNEEYLQKWKSGQTGFPYIDAIMIQLRTEGWIHHLARHSVACFLTRGDLYISWEEGVKVFDLYLLDADWSLNNANWMWLSASSFFYQFFRVYSPIAFGQKTDKSGNYIRKYIPRLADFPDKYIYEPWKAPLAVQQKCGCIIGEDYPLPMVDHTSVSKINMGRMKVCYDANKAGIPIPAPKEKVSSKVAPSKIVDKNQKTLSFDSKSSSTKSKETKGKKIATKRSVIELIDGEDDDSIETKERKPKQQKVTTSTRKKK